MDERKAFFDAGADSWDAMGADINRVHKVAGVADWFDITPGQTVLDVGTGAGILLPFLSTKVTNQGLIIGMDFAYQMLEKAQKRTGENPITLTNAGVGAIPFREATFDRVTCFSAFPHFPDKKRALAEMIRVLKPGGRLYIAHMHSIEEIAELHGSVGGAVKMDHLPRPENMAALMEDAGLTDVQVTNEPGKYLAFGRRP
jgi:ubiquinone/menaquinone biosynthesis C-methylase UbiE